MQIAVLGGGLSGLSAAFSLSYRFPAAQVLLFEKSKRLGGWARSEFADIHGRRVLLEGGPRTLRPQGAAVLELIRHLGIENELITISKSSPAAKKRYVYIPPGQLRGVSGLNTVGLDLSSPLMKKFLWPTLRAPLRYFLRKDAQDGNDESIHSFASRILGEEMATAVGSAVLHGVYAADSRQLSAHSTLPFWSPKSRNQFLTNPHSTIESDVVQPLPNIGALGETLKDVAVYSFKNGNETLTRALEQHLEQRSNAHIFRESPILNLLMRKDHTYELSYLTTHKRSTFTAANPTHVVSALPLPTFHAITQSKPTKDTSPYPTSANITTSLSSIPHLTTNTSSSVHVLNLVFPVPPSEIHPPGFGYLIPRPREGYPSQASDEQPGILGVVFDSCSTSQQDEPGMTPEEWYENGTHTKVTVMLGGPYPLYIPSTMPVSPPSSPHGNVEIPIHIRTILRHISKHLSRPLPDPIYYRLWRNDNCIPTYSIGHRERMREMQKVLRRDVSEGGWGGRVEVIGAGVSGVSVPDCVLAGRNAGLRWL
ncbi:Protoporphyrinogen oxidase [Macrolepiota fuliginosa MF-IS2]|uniref:Protoporphyrinogen oxidase n=1 Tax=Macrolepiota fuliginosa MF-IS2 TaxID=1400762 RepID=A0A9P5X8D3_9AGAR|nr:Protoporphyrinogen oxidase [Macrolepiota fuliginosa MF-IS2]